MAASTINGDHLQRAYTELDEVFGAAWRRLDFADQLAVLHDFAPYLAEVEGTPYAQTCAITYRDGIGGGCNLQSYADCMRINLRRALGGK